MLQDVPTLPGSLPIHPVGLGPLGSSGVPARLSPGPFPVGAPPGHPANPQHPAHPAALPAPGGGKPRGNKREKREQKRGGGGDKEREQEKQDDRTLAPQPSAKLQTGLLRWKAAVS